MLTTTSSAHDPIFEACTSVQNASWSGYCQDATRHSSSPCSTANQPSDGADHARQASGEAGAHVRRNSQGRDCRRAMRGRRRCGRPAGRHTRQRSSGVAKHQAVADGGDLGEAGRRRPAEQPPPGVRLAAVRASRGR